MIKLLALIVIFASGANVFSSSAASAAASGAANESDVIARAHIALTESQKILQSKLADASDESVASLADVQRKFLPAMLACLPELGMGHSIITRFVIDDRENGALAWFNMLKAQGNFGEFSAVKIGHGVEKGNCRTGNFNSDFGVNPHVFANQTYSLVRHIFGNGSSSNSMDIAWQYFQKLDEQNTSCCRGFIGRNFVVFVLAFAHVIEEFDKRLAIAQPTTKESAAANSGATDDADTLLARQTQQEEQQKFFAGRLKSLQDFEELARSNIFSTYFTAAPKLEINVTGWACKAFDFKMFGHNRHWSDLANKFYLEQAAKKEAERIAAEEKKLADERAALEEFEKAKLARIAVSKASLDEAENAIFGSPKSGYKNAVLFNDCMTEVMQSHKKADFLLALDLLAKKDSSLQPHVDVLKRAHLIRQESGAPRRTFESMQEDDKWRKASTEYVIARLVEDDVAAATSKK